MIKGRSLAIICILTIIFAASNARAQWVEKGTPLCTADADQYMTNPIADGAGGAFVTWEDYRSPGNGIYAHRIDAQGNILWPPNGINICTYYGYYPTGVIDGDGGVIIAWTDTRNGNNDIYAQRVDGDGNTLWTANGVPVVVITGSQSGITIVSDGENGAILCWADYRNTSADERVYAQRIDSNGNALWTTNGVLVCNGAGEEQNPVMTRDDNGDFIIVWRDLRNSSQGDIYAQKIDMNGNLLWGSGGYAICTAAGYQMDPAITNDGIGGAIIAWQNELGTGADIYAQRVNTYGVVWTSSGVPVCSAVNEQSDVMIVPDGNGGAVIGWRDIRNGDADLYAQRISSGGVGLWSPGGEPVCTSDGDLSWTRVVPDGAGGAIFAWEDRRNDPLNSDIYAQRIDVNGNLRWAADGLPVCTAAGEQAHEWITTDGAQGVIIGWDDTRPGTNAQDSYVLRVERNGYWGYPCPTIAGVADVPKDQGGKLTVKWTASPLDEMSYREVTHYSIWRSLTGPEAAGLAAGNPKIVTLDLVVRDFEGPAYRIEIQGGTAFWWEWLDNVSAHYLDQYSYTASTLYDSMGVDPGYNHFFISAHTSDPFVYWDSPADSGYSVDNLAPGMPLSFAGVQNHSPAGISLTWSPNPEADLSHYTVYRGLDESFTPAPGNLVASPPDTSAFDGGWSWDSGYYYKLAAVDIHGNESPYALLIPVEITGTNGPIVPLANCLYQNCPNPFNPSTVISYDLARAGMVEISIYDVAGQLVEVIENRYREPGRYEIGWNGQNAMGYSVSSGVYFYRLKTDGYTKTRKMLLLK